MPRTYVDNSMNRSLGRVGMAHGSMPVSRSGGGGGSSYSGGGGSYGGGGSSYSSGSIFGGGNTKTYVDNASNRSLGRVGMPHGSMPVSRSSGSSYSSGSIFGGGNTKTYVDNASNRSLGRVGMPHGSMPVSRSSGSSYSSGDTSSKTYVDNSSNRSLGRVGMPLGSMVVSKSGSSDNSSRASSSGTKSYVDNSYNRSIGRVGLEHGTAVISGKSPMSYRENVFNDSGIGASFFESPSPSPAAKVYKDNPLNRSLGRVGLPHGSAVHSRNSFAPASPVTKKYVDNAFNRSKGRVGKPLGSMSISRKSKTTSGASDIYRNYMRNPVREIDFPRMEIDEEQQYEACDVALGLIHRMEEVMRWQKETSTTRDPYTSDRVLQNYRGTKIDFKDIEIMQKIGSGGFGDVHFAKWKGTVVAAKKLRVQRVSKRRLKEFTDEIFLLCELEHPNIVKFIGASVVTPNLCIVMEYMQMSLFDALHIKDDVEFSEEEKIEIIQHTALGLEYLHDANIAHCDMKSQNVLLDYVAGETLVAKITDFGLSIMKNETETSTSAGGDYIRNIGTPRYSSPENLRGEVLQLRDLKMSDMYSYSLIVFEVCCEDEPFYKLTYQQLRKQVGELGLTPEIPSDVSLHSNVLRLLNKCWDREPRRRPTSKRFAEDALQFDSIYQID
ncbi:Hypothetical predicted protein [Mytilus galloprovincialis]|uniref:Protein kinase domain-containing protein n=1 Tax=Mytilus galloprovincialis TaxID=29158 RepID=A0A8B6CTW5_MYTGA|nr:Hypothetical predicted protein [Mytilus galloprovincialis]